MANYIEKIAKMLGVEMNEDFKCKGVGNTYRFTEHGLLCNGSSGADSLMMLLNGEHTIDHGPWKPADGERFYVVMHDGCVMTKYWDDDSTLYRTYYKIGNCYRDMNEAGADRDKWIAFYASDKVLEVCR